MILDYAEEDEDGDYVYMEPDGWSGLYYCYYINQVFSMELNKYLFSQDNL